MASPEAKLLWLLNFTESWIRRAENEKHTLPDGTERIRLDGQLTALRVLRNLIVSEERP